MAKIIGIARTCEDCPNRHYYSGGVYECLVTKGSLNADNSIPSWCPLPDYPMPRLAEIERLDQEKGE